MARNPRGPRKVLRCLFCDFTTENRKRAGSAVLAGHVWDEHLNVNFVDSVIHRQSLFKLCLCRLYVTRASFAEHCAVRGGLLVHLGQAALNLPDE